MGNVFYYLTLPVFYLLSVLPFRLLYIVSDGLYVILYYIIGYRKKVVTDNMRRSFPEKSGAEIKALRKQFYHYFCDLTLETFKTLTISPEKMLKRCSWDPSAKKIFDDLAAAGKSCVIVMGHKGNWEWAGNTFSLSSKHQLYVIYHPLANKKFNDLICGMRQRFGTKLIPMKETFRDMMNNKDHLTATAFIADQSPNPKNAHWMTFLNQDTPVFFGTERISKKVKYPIVFVSVKRLKRGYYTLKAEILATPPYDLTEGTITELHTKKLEADILEQPETWLWTHKRWKYKRP